MKSLVSSLVVIIVICSCGGDRVYTPKPKMYPRVQYPQKAFEQKDIEYCDFSFRAPSYTKIVQDKYFYEDKVLHPCWFDISIPELKADLHCSYYPIKSRSELDVLVSDAFKVTNEHNSKANYIEESLIEDKEANVHGLLFTVDGPVASPLQFYLTDSTEHFFRASLYFNSKVDPDSTAPIVKFLEQDIDTIISSWKWE